MKLKILTTLAFYRWQLIQEYLELLKDLLLNKKTKELKKGRQDLDLKTLPRELNLFEL